MKRTGSDVSVARRRVARGTKPRGFPNACTRDGEVVLENDFIELSVLVDQGADIHSLRYRPANIDVLWKPPALPAGSDVAPVAGDSAAEWHARYRGGWQTILPNFGPECVHRGVHYEFHGEAARVPWSVDEIANDRDSAVLVVSVTLRGLPLRVRRRISLGTTPVLKITETVANLADCAVDAMWGHHPVFGAPFLEEGCVLACDAEMVVPDDDHDVPGNDLAGAGQLAWGDDGAAALVTMPASGQGKSRVANLSGFRSGWFAVSNPSRAFGVGVAWDPQVFPYATVWQESGGITDYPMYGEAYALAVEPHTGPAGHGIARVANEGGGQLVFGPHESRTARLSVVCFEGPDPVAKIDLDGRVERG